MSGRRTTCTTSVPGDRIVARAGVAQPELDDESVPPVVVLDPSSVLPPLVSLELPVSLLPGAVELDSSALGPA